MQYTGQNERKLVERCLQGDNEAWEELFNTHCGVITSVIKWSKWGFAPHEIEDLRQTVLEQIVISLKNFNFQAKLGTFIHKLTVNVCISELRRRTAIKRGSDADPIPIDPVGGDEYAAGTHVPSNPGANQEEELSLKQDVEAYRRALESLDRACKEIIRLRCFEELPFERISERLKAKKNTLVQRLRRCMQRLVQVLRTEERHGSL